MGNLISNVIEKSINVMKDPEKFFKYVKNERGIKDGFVFFVVVSLVTLIGNIVLTAINPLSYKISIAFGSYLTSLVVIFIISGIYSLLIKLFGGEKNYELTFRTYAYSLTPALLFGWIPFVGIIAFFYSFYLTMKGFSIVHQISMTKSFFVLIIPVLVVLILVLTIILKLGAYYFRYL